MPIPMEKGDLRKTIELWKQFFEENPGKKNHLKVTLSQIQGGVCHHCNENLTEPSKSAIERLLPYAKGGRDRPEDTVLICGKCNKMKSDKRQVSTHLPIELYDRVSEWRDKEMPGKTMSQVVSYAMRSLLSDDATPVVSGEMTQMKKKSDEYDRLKLRAESLEKALFPLFEQIAPMMGYSRTNPFEKYISNDPTDRYDKGWV